MGGIYALIVAAGRGHRVGGPLPKQYRDLAGQPMLRRAVCALQACPAIAGVRVVIHPDDHPLYDRAVEGLDLLSPVHGGETRQDSSLNGLESLVELTPSAVLIHDAARPFVGRETLAAVVDRLESRAPGGESGVLVAVPVVDTLKRVAGSGAVGGTGATVGGTVDREGLWRAQTPQAFDFGAILQAHRAARGKALTDDVAVAEAAGLTIGIVEGTEQNFKVTTDDDFQRAERLLSAAPLLPRVGTGFDVHTFGPGDHLWLCGLRVAHDRGLVGHSDADVGLHALTDAILGALGDHDIGYHFPDSDPQWKGAASDRFLAHACALVAARGGRIQHLDLTIICEAPRLRPHHDAMVARVAEIAGLAPSQVSIKATTTEKLGFTGRGEGIAGQAAATVLLPDEQAA